MITMYFLFVLRSVLFTRWFLSLRNFIYRCHHLKTESDISLIWSISSSVEFRVRLSLCIHLIFLVIVKCLEYFLCFYGEEKKIWILHFVQWKVKIGYRDCFSPLLKIIFKRWYNTLDNRIGKLKNDDLFHYCIILLGEFSIFPLLYFSLFFSMHGNYWWIVIK